MPNHSASAHQPFAPLSAFAAALTAVLVGFGGTVALIMQAEQQVGGTPGQITSAVSALCLGIGLGSIILSLWRRIPIVLAWSTPGAALIGTNTLAIIYPVAVGAFMAAAALMVFLGMIPALGKLAGRRQPPGRCLDTCRTPRSIEP